MDSYYIVRFERIGGGGVPDACFIDFDNEFKLSLLHFFVPRDMFHSPSNKMAPQTAFQKVPQNIEEWREACRVAGV